MTRHSDNIASSADSGDQPLMTGSDVQYPPHYFAAILYQLALLGDLSKSALLDNLHILEISPVSHRRANSAEISDTLNVLRKDGWSKKVDNRWRLVPGHENAVFLWLLTHPDIWRTVQQGIGYSRLRGILRPDRARMWLAILGGDTSTLPEYLSEWVSGYDYVASAQPTASLLADNAGKQAFALLDGDVQTLLLATFLSDASYRLSECADIWRFACDYGDAMPSIPSVLRGPLALHALWRDDRTRLERLTAEGNLPLTVTGWIVLCRGDREGAMDAYRQLVSQYRKATRKRKLHLPAAVGDDDSADSAEPG